MTDGELVRVMARIYHLTEQVTDLMNEDVLNHPNGEALLGELRDEGLGYSWDCALITHPHLVHPERWVCMGGTLKSKRAAQAKPSDP